MEHSLEQRVFIYNTVTYESWRTVLVTNIRHEIGAISKKELRRVAGHVFKRCATYHTAQGHHFEHEL